MKSMCLAPGADHEGFRVGLRGLITGEVPPTDVIWQDGAAPGLWNAVSQETVAPPVLLPRGLADTIRLVVCHRDPERYGLLYALVWRILQGEKRLPEMYADPLVHRLYEMEKSVRRDLHKMHAFLRFRQVSGEDRFAAWFEPAHFILQETASFFVDRFRGMHWTILTPDGSLTWDRERLTSGPPGMKTDAPSGDGFEDGWRDYYESSFNPARLNPDAMRQHMPKKYWANLPEARSIRELIRTAPSRVKQMIEQEALIPVKRDPAKAVAAMEAKGPASLAALNRIIVAAEPMVAGGTRAVLGEGPMHPLLAFVGEQPGDQEDLEGKPFVGPAGQLLDRALEEAGINRGEVYVTNAVKHFKFEQRGKRRLHSRPNAGEVKHYRWWLEKELDLVKPRLVVALGATAILGVSGQAMPVLKNRGPAELGRHAGFITVHPSSLLRAPDESARRAGYASFVQDLKAARRLAMAHKGAA